MSCRGLSKRLRAPSSALRVTATVNCTPRKAWSAATPGAQRQLCPWVWRSASSRGKRSVGSDTARTYSGKTICWAGVGHTTSANPRRGAGPQLARPAERMSWRSRKALRRAVAAFPSCSASSRARTTSRMASSSTPGTYPGVRSPDRSSRASCTASRRSVLTRSPACLGIWEGATTQHLRFFLVRYRYNQYPHGPASYTKCSVLPFDCNFRINLSMSHCRVPIVPSDTPSASRSSATYATAIVSLWTSNPIKSVLPCALADLLLYINAALYHYAALVSQRLTRGLHRRSAAPSGSHYV